MTVADQVERRPPAKRSDVQEGKSPTDGRAERDRLRMMILIRRFEERTDKEYKKGGRIGGFCHLYSGQEAIAVGCAAIFDKSKDYLINGYRCHGHSLALGMTPHAAMAELFGKATGCSKGKGGSMHLFEASVGNNGRHGICAVVQKIRGCNVLLSRGWGGQSGDSQRIFESGKSLQVAVHFCGGE